MDQKKADMDAAEADKKIKDADVTTKQKAFDTAKADNDKKNAALSAAIADTTTAENFLGAETDDQSTDTAYGRFAKAKAAKETLDARVDGEKDAMDAAQTAMDNAKKARDNEKNRLVNEYASDLSFPTPKFTNGLWISAWVKAPETVERDDVIFSFYRNDAKSVNGGLWVTAGGDVLFNASDRKGKGNESKRNVYATYNVDQTLVTPAGKWVYLTLAVDNSGAKLYVNGEPVNSKYDSNYDGAKGKNGGQYFMGGMGLYNADSKNKDFRAKFNSFFKEFTAEEVAAFAKAESTYGADVEKFTIDHASGEMLLEWISNEGTQFMVGGISENITLASNPSDIKFSTAFNESLEGMEIDDLQFMADLGIWDSLNTSEINRIAKTDRYTNDGNKSKKHEN